MRAAAIAAVAILSGCASTGEGDGVGVNGSGNFVIMGDLIVNKSVGAGCTSTTGGALDSEAGAGGDAGATGGSATTASAAAKVFESVDKCPDEDEESEN